MSQTPAEALGNEAAVLGNAITAFDLNLGGGVTERVHGVVPKCYTAMVPQIGNPSELSEMKYRPLGRGKSSKVAAQDVKSKKVVIMKMPVVGFGMYASEKILKGEIVHLFAGKVLPEMHVNTYNMNRTNYWVVVGGANGAQVTIDCGFDTEERPLEFFLKHGAASLANWSNTPNCTVEYTPKIEMDQRYVIPMEGVELPKDVLPLAVFLVAKDDIDPGDEITWKAPQNYIKFKPIQGRDRITSINLDLFKFKESDSLFTTLELKDFSTPIIVKTEKGTESRIVEDPTSEEEEEEEELELESKAAKTTVNLPPKKPDVIETVDVDLEPEAAGMTAVPISKTLSVMQMAKTITDRAMQIANISPWTSEKRPRSGELPSGEYQAKAPKTDNTDVASLRSKIAQLEAEIQDNTTKINALTREKDEMATLLVQKDHQLEKQKKDIDYMKAVMTACCHTLTEAATGSSDAT